MGEFQIYFLWKDYVDVYMGFDEEYFQTICLIILPLCLLPLSHITTDSGGPAATAASSGGGGGGFGTFILVLFLLWVPSAAGIVYYFHRYRNPARPADKDDVDPCLPVLRWLGASPEIAPPLPDRYISEREKKISTR